MNINQTKHWSVNIAKSNILNKASLVAVNYLKRVYLKWKNTSRSWSIVSINPKPSLSAAMNP